MIAELSKLIDLLKDPLVTKTSVISWGSPIISFGNIKTSRIATLGLNPSNREFMDRQGKELNGSERRFHTLGSLRIKSWEDVNPQHLKLILDFSNNYFIRNPYDTWFKKLDYLISGANASYYFPTLGACHLDLIPFATLNKWSDLSARERTLLLELCKDTLSLVLKDSNIDSLVLNGQTVVDNFEKISQIKLERRKMVSWGLPRRSENVNGYSYFGEINRMSGYDFSKPIFILGYNHNIQSSFGVTTKVLTSIRNWITETYKSNQL